MRCFLSILLLLGLTVSATAQDEALATAAKAALAERFPTEAHRLDVRVVRTGGEVDASMAMDWPAAELPRAHTRITLRQGSRTGWALLYVAHFDSVVVPVQALRQNDAVAPSDVEVRWLETTNFHGEPLRWADWQALDGERFATRSLREGRPLQRRDVRGAYAAELGAAVAMRYARGPIVLNLSCTARQRGFVGDIVRLHAPATDTHYRARLTAQGEAEWVETL